MSPSAVNPADRLTMKRLETRIKAELRQEIAATLAAEIELLRSELIGRVDDLDRRVTDVHSRALRALTDRAGRNQPR